MSTKFEPKLDWLMGSIVYLEYNFKRDKLGVYYKYNGEEFYNDLEPGKDFKPFIYLSSKDSDKFNNIRHSDYYSTLRTLKKSSGRDAFLLSPETEFLIQGKRNFFENMVMSDLRIVIFDIETNSLDWTNGEILAIGVKGNFPFKDGTTEKIFKSSPSEKNSLGEFIEFIQEENPDILTGHNIFTFDLPFIEYRLMKNGLPAEFGRFRKQMYRDASTTKVSRLIKGNEFYQYRIPGRYLIDTMHLAMIEDTRRNEFESYSLKYLAVELGIAPEDRVYLEPEDILAFFYSDYSKFSKYLLDDLEETLGLIKIFLPSYLASSKNIPINIQDIVYAGATRKATALFMIDYYDAQKAIPKPQPKKQFEGAISKAQEHGIYYNVHKYDVSSLYPSIMMTFKYFPKLDTLGVFEKYLRKFTADRLHFKKLLKKEEEKIERGEGSVKLKEEYDSYQLFAKIFINSFYGILGNEFFAFNDYDMAAAVTAKGREILMNMLEIIEQAGGVILSLDTDGIYYSAPDGLDPKALLDKINVAMSKGIVVEFEKSFKAMFSYKGKTYAALTNDGKLIVKGSAFKGRGKPSFIRKFLRSALMDFLTQNFDSYREKLFLIKHAIADRTLNVEEMIESKTISYDYNKYISRTAGGKMGHFEAMEREEKTDSYKAGDKVYYYYAGDTYTKKTKSDMVKLYDKENVIPYNSDYYIEMVKNWEDAFEPFIKEKDVI